jgi:DNA-binding transcriptional LysR family regulator
MRSVADAIKARVELRQLRYFIAVAEELHFGHAAARLHIAQPPLSQQIKHLENELHTQLLWRTKRHVELTEAGEAFLEEARKTLAQVEHAARVARSNGLGKTGQLELGFIDTATYGFLPELLRTFREHHPDVQVVLHEMTSGELVEALKRGQIQVALLRPTRGGSQLQFHEIGRERLVVAMPRRHRLSRLPEVPVQELEHEGWILFPRLLSPGLHDYLLGICRKAGFTPRVVQEARVGHTIVGLVAAGLGITLITESLKHWGRSDVVYKPLQAATVWLPMSIGWRKDERAQTVHSFLKIVRERSDWGERATSEPRGRRQMTSL